MNCPHCLNSVPDESSYCNHCGLPPSGVKKRERSLLFYATCAVAVLLVCYLFMRQTAGSRQTDRVIASVTHTPIVLDDETQNLRAASWRAVPLNTPYTGNLDVELQVTRGNPLDVILVDANQMDILKSSGWRNVASNPNFAATKTATYHRNALMEKGVYYLVLRDTSLGILSASATDVAVKATLNP